MKFVNLSNSPYFVKMETMPDDTSEVYYLNYAKLGANRLFCDGHQVYQISRNLENDTITLESVEAKKVTYSNPNVDLPIFLCECNYTLI